MFTTNELHPISTKSINRSLVVVFSTNNWNEVEKKFNAVCVRVYEANRRYYYDVRGYNVEKTGIPTFPYMAYSSTKNVDFKAAARFLMGNPELER